LRRKKPSGEFERLLWQVRIREGDQPRWIKHKEADVAAAYVVLPDDAAIKLLPTTLLADDATFERFEVHPGDELNCLGFPYGEEANAAGFPILRSGKVASYPLTPAARVKTFLYDFQVYGGNSGGPVYMSQQGIRAYGGTNVVGGVQFIAGVVIQERAILERTRTLRIERVEKYPLYLAVVAPAHFIRETINMLPQDGPVLGRQGAMEGKPVSAVPAQSK
jgi:hypothetical protein